LLDIDGFDLFSELDFLRKIIGLKNDKSFDILNYIKRMNSFPNAHINYKIILTIDLVERSFSKLKIIKTYLR